MIAVLFLSASLAKPLCIARCAPVAADLCDGRPRCTRVHLKKLVRQCRHERPVCTTTTTTVTTPATTTTTDECALGCSNYYACTPSRCCVPCGNCSCTTSTTTTLPAPPYQ
jgi:hypothetical protein